MEVADGIHRIEAPLAERYVCLYLVVGEEAALLVDTGIAASPRDVLEPYLESIGLDPGRIRYVLISHADFDHTGGNEAVRALCPDAVFLCHELDRPLIDDLEALLDRRYGEFRADHGIDDGDEVRDWIRANARHVPIDIGLSGGERLILGEAREVEILHTPGHSRGHLTVWDPRSRAAIVADAALWNTVLTAGGEAAFPPTYRYVETYVASVQRLQGMPIELLLTSHYPVHRGDQVDEFLAETRAFVDRVDRVLREELAGAPDPPTLRELCERFSPRLGTWPEAAAPFLAYPLLGHLERLSRLGLVSTGKRDGLVAWQWEGE